MIMGQIIGFDRAGCSSAFSDGVVYRSLLAVLDDGAVNRCSLVGFDWHSTLSFLLLMLVLTLVLMLLLRLLYRLLIMLLPMFMRLLMLLLRLLLMLLLTLLLMLILMLHLVLLPIMPLMLLFGSP